jgi:hypothetical protein
VRGLLMTVQVAALAGLIAAGCSKPQAPPDPQGSEPPSNIAVASPVEATNTAEAEPAADNATVSGKAAATPVIAGPVDGQTLDQMLERTMNRFAKLDLNGDGRLTQDELNAATSGGDPEANVRRPRTGFSARAFERADANGDGVVTRQEAEKQTRDRFKTLDANADGTVSRDEMAADRGRNQAHTGDTEQ